MRKFLFIISLVSLLLVFSLVSFSASNNYLFSDSWNQSAFLKSRILSNGSNFVPETFSASSLVLDYGNSSVTLGHADTLSFSAMRYSYAYSTSYDVSIPLGYYLNAYDNLEYSMYLFLPYDNSVTVTARAVLSNSNVVSLDVNKTNYSSAEIQSYNYNAAGVVTGVNTLYTCNDVYKLDFSLNANSNNYDIDYIVVSISLSDNSSYMILGALGSTELVTLPESVENSLALISKKINLTNERILTLLNELRLTNDKIDEILSALASSSASTTVLTQFLQTPSAEQQEVTQQLEQLLEEAQQELSAVKDVLESVQTPSYNDLIDINREATETTIDILSRSDVKDITYSIFDSFIYLTPILLSVLGIATVGYILFGKRG